MPTYHLVTGEYPPHAGGVGDYTQLVAAALAARGCEVHVWSPAVSESRMDGDVHLHRLEDGFGPASRRALELGLAEAPGRVLLQYVPNALGARGANFRFCRWLQRAGRRADVRIMFHEPYFYFGWQHPLRNGLALAQRFMAAALLRAGSTAYASTDAWRPHLGSWAPPHLRIVVTPIPTTVARDAEGGAVARWRMLFTRDGHDAAIVGHFGTYGDHVARDLGAVLPLILRAEPGVRVVCLGRGSDTFVEELPVQWHNRVLGTGALSREDMAAALRACDLVVQPYPDGVTTRRTSVMAALANGVATVTSSGALTEGVWSERRAVGLAAAGDAAALSAAVTRLLRNPDERAALAARGQRLYDEAFALECTISALLHGVPEPAGA